MKKQVFSIFAACVCMITVAGEADQHTLFYCSFDEKLDADSAVGSSSIKGQASLTEKKGGKFGEALIVRNEVCVSPSEVNAPYKFLSAQPKNNYKPELGTLEMWIKLADPKPATPPRTVKSTILTKLVAYDNFGQQSEWAILRLTYNPWSNYGTNWYLEFEINDKDSAREYKGGDWIPNHARALKFQYSVADWTEKDWHHVALTWNGNQFRLFIDGRLVKSASSRFNGISKNANQMHIGGSFGAEDYSLPCLIDELQISDIVRYTADFKPGEGR